MGGEFAPSPNVLLVQWVFDKPFHSDNGSFVHLVTDNGPDYLSFHSSLFHGANYYSYPRLLLRFRLSDDGLYPCNIPFGLFQFGGVFELTGSMLKTQIEILLLDVRRLLFHLIQTHTSDVGCLHYNSPLSTILVLIGSLWAASRIASRAPSSDKPEISNMIRPGLTTATQ